MTRFPQVLVNVPVARVADLDLGDARVREEIARDRGRARRRGRVLVRASGTEPVVRVMVEAPTEPEAEAAVAPTARVPSRPRSRLVALLDLIAGPLGGTRRMCGIVARRPPAERSRRARAAASSLRALDDADARLAPLIARPTRRAAQRGRGASIADVEHALRGARGTLALLADPVALAALEHRAASLDGERRRDSRRALDADVAAGTTRSRR